LINYLIEKQYTIISKKIVITKVMMDLHHPYSILKNLKSKNILSNLVVQNHLYMLVITEYSLLHLMKIGKLMH